jgi:hypothetical protein
VISEAPGEPALEQAADDSKLARSLRLQFPRRGWVASAWAAAAYLALALLLFASTWRSPLTNAIAHPGGDTQQVMWGLAWVPYALIHGIDPFFSTYLGYPQGVNLLWNTFTVPALALSLWPVTATLGVVFAYNVLATLAVALSAWTAFLLIRRYVARPVAAGAGGLLYGFSPYMAAHSLGHMNLTPIFLLPLILLVIDEIVRVQQRHPIGLGLALAVLCATQFFISEEVLVITGLMSVVTLATAWALWPEQATLRVRGALKAFIPAALLLGAVIAGPAAYQLLGPLAIHGPQQPPDIYVNDLLNFWVPSGLQWIDPRRAQAIAAHFSGNAAEWNSYLGVPLSLLLVFIAFRWWDRGVVRLAALAGLVAAILSLGIMLHLNGKVEARLPVFVLALPLLALPSVPARALVLTTFLSWVALWRLPLVEDVLPARIFLFGYLCAGLLMAVFVDAILRAGGRRAAFGLGALIVGLLPLIPVQPYPHTEPLQPAFFAAGGQISRVPAGSVAMVAPVASVDNAASMQWQASAGMRYRMPEGYMFVPASSGSTGPGAPPTPTTQALLDAEHGAPAAVGSESSRRSIRADLTALNVQTVIVGPMAHEDRAVALLTWAIGRPPEHVQGVYVWWDVRNGA